MFPYHLGGRLTLTPTLTLPYQVFPYHLAFYVCRVMRVSAFKYYHSILVRGRMRGSLKKNSQPKPA